ncbi:hypothetical protein ABPG72_019839 [Tetrahymena utriculariae]
MQQNQYSQLIKKDIVQANLAKTSQESWNILLKGKYLTLSARPYKNSEKKILKIQGLIPANVNQCANYFFNNNESIKNNYKQCEAFDLLEEIDQDTKVTVFKLKQMKDGVRRESLNLRHKQNICNNEVLIIKAHLDEHQKLKGYFLNDPKTAIPCQLIAVFAENFLQCYEKDVETILKQQ